MAEIKIEKKKPIWPWILLLAVIAAVVYFLFFWDNNLDNEADDRDDNEIVTTTDNEEYDEYDNDRDSEDMVMNNSTVAEYVNYIAEDEDKMGLDHEFTNEAFMKLIAATEAVADDLDYDIKKDMDEIEGYADKITNDPYETSHADNIKKAAEKLATVMHNLQQRANTELENEAKAVKDAAAAIDAKKLTLDQKTTVKSFFTKASSLLEKMNQ